MTAGRSAAAALALAVAAYAAAVAPETVRQHRALATRAYDLGIFENVFWNTVHGRPFFSSLEGGSHLGVHTSFIFLAVAPLYALVPRTETLLVVQTLLLALAAWPLFLVARDLGFPPWAGAAVGAAWLLHPAVAGANFYDFHELAFGPVLFFAAVHFLLAEKTLPFAAATALLLCVKEDMSLVVASLGVWCLLRGRRREGLALVAAGIAAYLLLQKGLIPHFAGHEHSFSWYYGDLIPPGAGPLSLLATIALHPLRAARYVSSPDRLRFVAQLLGPLLFVPLLSLRALVLVAYGLLMSLCASRPALHQLGFQYPLQILPYAFVGALEAVSRWRLRAPRLLPAFAAASAAAAFAASLRWGLLAPEGRFVAGFRTVRFGLDGGERARFAEVSAMARAIPPDATVTASETLVPQVARRAGIWTLRYAWREPGRTAEYFFVLNDDLTEETRAAYPEVFASYRTVRRGAAATLLRRP